MTDDLKLKARAYRVAWEAVQQHLRAEYPLGKLVRADRPGSHVSGYWEDGGRVGVWLKAPSGTPGNSVYTRLDVPTHVMPEEAAGAPPEAG